MAKKRNRFIKSIAYMLVGMVAIVNLFIGVTGVFERDEAQDQLEKQKDSLVEKQKDIEEEVDALQDDDYVTRYARENYIFTADGEKVVIIPN